MFGSRNGRKIEPRRIPSKRKIAKQASTCCGGCCTSLANCCASCGAHGWFLTLFCGYVLVSSLPRILVVLDFIITLSLYFDINGYHGFNSTQTWLRNSFSFKQSTFDVVILSFVRCIILFICFAYRYQREGYRKNIYISSLTVLLTSVYLIIKLLYNETSIVIFSLSFVWIECIFFFMVRRRRIRYSPSLSNIGSYYSLSQRERKIMKPGKSKYYRIEDEEQSPHASLVNNNVTLNYNSSSDDIKPNPQPHPIAIANATPPPFINDTYMDDYVGAKKQKHPKRRQSTEKLDGEEGDEEKDEYKYDGDEERHSDGDEEEVDKSDKNLLSKWKKQRKRKVKERERQKNKRKFMEKLSNHSIEHSMSALSATVPDSEFSAHELPLKTENSEFFIVDGVTIHYCLEKNFNETVINNEDIPWIVLLHGFGGGVFSWKRTMPMLLNELGDQIRGILAFDRVGFGLTERPLIATEEDEEQQLQQPLQPQTEQKQDQDTESESMNPYSIEFDLKILKTFLDKFNMTKCILIGHSTGCLLANWFAYHYPSYCEALILISAATEMPSFIRSILKTKLGKPIILSLVRSEIGQVTLHQAWHNPSCIPTSVIHSYKQVLKLKNWNESLLEMARVKPFSSSAKYHKALSRLTCPAWLLHGDDDKLVTFRESVSLAQHFQFAFGPIKLRNCGHIPHEEIPKQFVKVIYQIVCQQLVQFEQHKSSYQLNLSGHENDDGQDDGNIINKGAKKIKDMMKNIHIIHRKGSNDISKLTQVRDDRTGDEIVNANANMEENQSHSLVQGSGDHNIDMLTEDNVASSHVTENSALLSD